MGIKETPTNFRVYYKSMITANTRKKKEAVEAYNKLCAQEKVKYEEVKSRVADYITNFHVDLMVYDEFINNKYSDGKFLKLTKGMFINRSNNYELDIDLYDLFTLARQQFEISNLEHNIEFINKLLSLTLKQYTEILRVYYTEVHKKLILEGGGYNISNGIGWICVNRCVIKRRRPRIDYAATKKREAELKAAGKRLYNKEEAEWCKRNGIPYEAEDKRVYMNNEYCYEIPLISSKMPNGHKLKLEISDYRHSSLRGNTNDQLIERCNNDITKICELPIDLKTKLTLCDKTDKILYTKFIRNEGQQSINTPKANRKN